MNFSDHNLAKTEFQSKHISLDPFTKIIVIKKNKKERNMWFTRHCLLQFYAIISITFGFPWNFQLLKIRQRNYVLAYTHFIPHSITFPSIYLTNVKIFSSNFLTNFFWLVTISSWSPFWSKNSLVYFIPNVLGYLYTYLALFFCNLFLLSVWEQNAIVEGILGE